MSGAPKSRVKVWRDAVRDSELDRTAKLVAHTLSTYFSANAASVERPPSRATLASGASLCDRAVDAALARLETEGFLEIDPPAGERVYTDKHGQEHRIRARPGGNSGPNKYVAKLPSSANVVRTAEWARANGKPPSANRIPPSANGLRTKALESDESVEGSCQPPLLELSDVEFAAWRESLPPSDYTTPIIEAAALARARRRAAEEDAA